MSLQCCTGGKTKYLNKFYFIGTELSLCNKKCVYAKYNYFYCVFSLSITQSDSHWCNLVFFRIMFEAWSLLISSKQDHVKDPISMKRSQVRKWVISSCMYNFITDAARKVCNYTSDSHSLIMVNFLYWFWRHFTGPDVNKCLEVIKLTVSLHTQK